MVSQSSLDIKNEGALFSIFGSQPGEIAHGLIEKKIYPAEGGVLVKMVGCSYLFKGYPSRYVLEQLGASKDLSWFIIGLIETGIAKLILILTFLFSRKRFWNNIYKIANEYFKVAYNPLKEKGYIPNGNKDYSVSIKELYRASEVVLQEIKDIKRQEIFSKLRDIVLMILEYDTCYRFISQDLLAEVNKDNLKKDLTAEIKRLLEILFRRETSKSVFIKWRRVEKRVILLTRIPFIKKWIFKILNEIDYDKVKMDESDWYYILRNPHYLFKDVSFEERLAEAKRIDKEKGHTIPLLDWVVKPFPHFEIVPKEIIKNDI